MRVACVICSDAFVTFTEVAAIPCGHTFHVQCILQWIENSKSCPTCRHKATAKNVLKLFFDSAGPGDTQADPDSLQNKIDSLKFQIVEKNQLLKNAQEEKENSLKITKQLRDEVVKLEKSLKTKEIKICAFQEQTKHLDSLIKNASKAEEDAREAKAELKLLRQVKLMVDENASDIEDTIICNSSGASSTENIKNLSTIICVLKSRMNKLLEEKRRCYDENNALASKLRETKKCLHNSEDKLRDLQVDYNQQKEDLKSIERENSSLQKKISKLQEAITSPSADVKNSVIQRLISESPAPVELKKRASDDRDILDLTPEITRKFSRSSQNNCDVSVSNELPSQTGTEASPYLRVKSASITALNRRLLAPASSKIVGTESANSIFKEGRNLSRSPSLPLKTWTKTPVFPSDSFGYDGMGGHHKVDYFPNPNQTKIFPTKKRLDKPVKIVTNKGAAQIASKTIKDFFKDPFADY